MDSTVGRNHAIVIGGSVSGLLAARIATDHFDRVTLLDRDHFPKTAEDRKGVPQGRHLHLLLMRGREILETLFPGLQEELAADGAPMVRWFHDIRAYVLSDWMRVFDFGFTTPVCSRILLEWRLRQRMITNPKLHIMEGCDVLDLTTTSDKSRVTGVRFRSRDDRQESTLEADLVIDASGRESHTPEWLEALGYGKTDETVVNSFLGYATRVYEKPADSTDWRVIAINNIPPRGTRGGGIMEVEGGKWIVTLFGVSKDYPPTDEAEFLEFSRTLVVPTIYNAIKDAKPLSGISGYQRTHNRVRHFERFPRWPRGFLAMGDAVCAFNPVYGQGMTVAAVEAIVLDEWLKSGDLMGITFQKKIKKATSAAWLLATGADMRNPIVEGTKPGLLMRLSQLYLDQVLDMISVDVTVGRAFASVQHLLKEPSSLFSPAMMIRVLRYVLTVRKPYAEKASTPAPNVAQS